MKHYDAIIIGAGQAGIPLGRKLGNAGKTVAIIEKRLVGGTCINDGCTPTKAMVASARIAYAASKAAELGVSIGSIKVDLKKIKERKDQIVERFRLSSEKGLKSIKGITLIMGEAKFTGKKEITVNTSKGKKEVLTADWIFINTGATPNIPDIEGLAGVDFLTSTSILDLEKIPKHLVIIGGSYIALEFGQMFRRFGSKVTILEKSKSILAKEDDDVSEALTKIFEDEKMQIIPNSNVKKVSKNKTKEIVIEVTSGEKTKKLKASHLLIATGRKPQTQNLALENCGVKTDERGNIIVNEKLETNVKGIFALGDVKGGPAFTHIAYNDYTIVYRNLLKDENLTTKDRAIPYCMFTDPQLGRIALSEKEAKEQKLNYEAIVFPMSYVARAIETNETRGLMKVIVDPKTKKILGAAILGAEGGEVMSIIQMAMEGGITYDKIRYFIFAHPTYAEALNNIFMKIES